MPMSYPPGYGQAEGAALEIAFKALIFILREADVGVDLLEKKAQELEASGQQGAAALLRG